MPENNQDIDKERDNDEDKDQMLDVLWENWASRRKCERTHTPNFIKREPKEEE